LSVEECIIPGDTAGTLHTLAVRRNSGSSVFTPLFLANRRARGGTPHIVRRVRTLHKRRLRPPLSKRDDLEFPGAKSLTPPHLSPDWGAGNFPEPFLVLWPSGPSATRGPLLFPSACMTSGQPDHKTYLAYCGANIEPEPSGWKRIRRTIARLGFVITVLIETALNLRTANRHQCTMDSNQARCYFRK
jgi:hypothetical protein